MFVFVCAGCGAELTAPLSQAALPVHARQKYGNAVQLPALMKPGTFAVDPEPSGPPWRRWEEITPDEAAARGIYAPVHALSDGAPGAIVIAPGDTRNTALLPKKRGGACCGIDGADGPNMACMSCGLPAASRIDDCSLWQAVWLAPDAVRRLPAEGTEDTPLSWAELVDNEKGTPPFEPMTMVWGSRLGLNSFWSWSPQWEAAAGQALAHLLAASQGQPVTVPNGLTSQMFQRALDALLPAGGTKRPAVLAGPDLPVPDKDADILLVPVHPQTGQTWNPPDSATSAYRIPLPFEVWQWMIHPEPHLPTLASGVMPDGVFRDDPPAPPPHQLFRTDRGAFQHTLVRLPAARAPWLRQILENLTQHIQTGIF
ncbi:hypothetical protein GTW43_03565 [Streptomyces sp. SID5785]|uniref:hypothetical protein n=1 Tax=Streptomyces sp. SID5785 TaxID=2690309 RepID=UPI001360E923|nr:hypothetical protein [Streptomyces sp. SID5785]MZD04161.1 hypothetical protein [Streptomyces sp. SID5785]